MPRAAGDSGYYELAIIDGTGQPTGRSILLPSVTHILKALPKNGLEWWGYKMGLTEARRILATTPVTAAVPAGSAIGVLGPPDDDDFYEEMKKLGRDGKVSTPYNALRDAGKRGTNAHDLAEKLAKSLFTDGKLPPSVPIPSDLTGYANALVKFYKEKVVNKLQVVQVEIPVVSLINQYAGTLDLILHDPATSTYYIVDFKTSKGIYESHLLQITAYEHAAKEQEWIPRNAATIGTVVRLGEDGNYELRNTECELADFMHVYRVWQWLEAMNGKGA